MDEIREVKSRKILPEEKSWREHLRRLEQDIPNRIEDAAKFLATMISVSLTFFLSIGKTSLTAANVPVKLTVALWLGSLLLAFVVLFPFRYKVHSGSAADIRRMHRKIAIVKRLFLVLSLAMFFLALLILTFLFLGSNSGS